MMEVTPLKINLKANTPAFLVRSGRLDCRMASARVRELVRAFEFISLMGETANNNLPAWLLLFSGGLETFYLHSPENDLISVLGETSEIEILTLETIRNQVKEITIQDNQGAKFDIPTDQLTNLQVAQIMSAFGEVEGDKFCGIAKIRVNQKTINVGNRQESKLEGVVEMIGISGHRDAMQFGHFPFSSSPLQPGDFSHIQFSSNLFPTFFEIQANNK